MEECQFGLHEGELRDHYTVLVALSLFAENSRQAEVNPRFGLFWKSVKDWDADLVAAANLLEVLLPTLPISSGKAKLLDLSAVLLKEEGRVEALEGLLPHFHNKEMGIEGILSLLC